MKNFVAIILVSILFAACGPENNFSETEQALTPPYCHNAGPPSFATICAPILLPAHTGARWCSGGVPQSGETAIYDQYWNLNAKTNVGHCMILPNWCGASASDLEATGWYNDETVAFNTYYHNHVLAAMNGFNSDLAFYGSTYPLQDAWVAPSGVILGGNAYVRTNFNGWITSMITYLHY